MEKLSVQYFNTFFVTKVFKIGQSKEVDIWGIVPLIRKLFGDSHASNGGKAETHLPMAKIWESDYTLSPYPKHSL